MQSLLKRILIVLIGIFAVCSISACSAESVADQPSETSQNVASVNSAKAAQNADSKSQKPRECKKFLAWYIEEPKPAPNLPGGRTCCKDINNDGVLDCSAPKKQG
ncbi:MAG: hypothetical protein KME45_24510 [Stenomitos rutilans HA7619-LM2]|jgi:hypothetical protein|nr:hypothetical protein [Stenomitos rutilans HA7619-LM2]